MTMMYSLNISSTSRRHWSHLIASSVTNSSNTRIWLHILLLFTITSVIQAEFKANEHANDYMDKELEAGECGPHPLQSIIDHYGGNLSHGTIVQLLAQVRRRARRLWAAYEIALARYTTCKLSRGSGTLG